MRKIDILANEKFNGDLNKAIEYCCDNTKGSEFNDYFKEFTQKEKDLCVSITFKRFGKENPDYMEKVIEETYISNSLNISIDEVRKGQKDAPKATMLKDILGLALSSSPNSVLRNACSMSLANKLVAYFKYKKYKEMVNSQDEDKGRKL